MRFSQDSAELRYQVKHAMNDQNYTRDKLANMATSVRTTQRNSPGYVLYHSHRFDPIKKQPEDPLLNEHKDKFSETQIIRAIQSKGVTRSVSPVNYGNGYEPRTIRLFNHGKVEANRDYNETTKVNGKIMDKSNIFLSVAKNMSA